MKRVVSLQYSSGKVLGVAFKQERRGAVFVGVAVVSPDDAKRFEGRDDFEVEDLDPAEANQFPDDFPLLGNQRAALAKAGLTDVDKLRAHDFAAQKVPGIGGPSEATIAAYLNPPPKPACRGAKGKTDKAQQAQEQEPATPPAPPADPPADPPKE